MYTASFKTIGLGVERKKPLLLRHFKTTRHFRPILHTLIIAPYPAAVCNFCSSDSFFRLLLHAITAATCHKDGNSLGRTLIATRPVCFDRLTPQTATTSYVIGSAIRAKTQLFHVKHRFLQCFSLEFYLLFELSLLQHCLMFHLFRYWFNRHAVVCFVDRCLLLLRVFARDLLCFLLCLLSSRSVTVCSGVRTNCF